MTASSAHVFSIPAGVDFLPALADSLCGGVLIPGFPARPEDLGAAVIYLPTRRAARALSMLLAERMQGKAVLLPRIVPLGEVDPLGLDLLGDDGFEDKATGLLPPVRPVERRLIFAQLVQKWSQLINRDHLDKFNDGIPFLVPSSPADAIALAGDLEALMDHFTVEDAPWSEMAASVEADYSRYFGLTLDFVRIATESWPQILAERGQSDPTQRHKALVEAETERLLRVRPETPMIVAGSTGSIPATARLIAAIAGLPNGAVVLPGLDTRLDAASWTMIGSAGDDTTDAVHGHPQTALHRLLTRFFRLDRSEVKEIGAVSAMTQVRNHFLSEALRPAESTDLWAAMPRETRLDLAARGLEGITLIEAADEREEALACAVALRETLERPGATAALVTPDRGLARRIAAELRRWNIVVEDSAGTALGQALAGRLARLAADVAVSAFEPMALLALLAHPLVTFGRDRNAIEAAAAVLEIGVLRGPAPAEGIAGLRMAFEGNRHADEYHAPAPRKRLTEDDWDLASQLLTDLETAFAGFSEEAFGETTDLAAFAAAHRRTVDCLCPGEQVADGSQGELDALFDELETVRLGSGIAGSFTDYSPFFDALADGRSVAPQGHLSHRRLKILGLLEARLLSADRIVLGGLDEGVWPPSVRTDAFLNRPMRAKLGLAPPERRIGQTAHDFAQLIAGGDVIISRAAKRDDAPTVPSRFLQRMKAFGGEDAWRVVTARGDGYRKLAALVEKHEPIAPLRRPEPKPDPSYFPRSLSVTEIETLVRDPYSIYARHVLKLDALDALAQAPGAADRGSIIHALFADFAIDFSAAIPDNGFDILIERGREAFRETRENFPPVYAEWWPRFERLAREFVIWERARRATVLRIAVEISGKMPIKLEDDSFFQLRGRADRIETHRDGRVVIVDFKTGSPPGLKEIYAGFAPQMTLEAAMVMAGAFADVPPPHDTPDLIYIHASGGNPALTERRVEPARGETRPVAEIVEKHRDALTQKLNAFISGRIGYKARPFPKYARRYSDYDHLARVKEWSLTSGEDGGEAE